MSRIVVAFALVIVLSGCKPDDDLSPPDIHLGQDTCHACGMIVSDERYAAACVIQKNGSTEKFLFDDVGEMLQFTPPAADQTRWYARDVGTRQWLDAAKATYVKSPKLETPMGTGVAAYADSAAAKKIASDLQTTTATFDSLHKPTAK